jgi:predicted PurR-regulated permease PerM
MEPSNSTAPNYNFEKIVDTIIRLGALILLLWWCIDIIKPFLLILIWAAVITIAIYPAFTFFVKLFRGKKILASVVLIVLFLSFLIVPLMLLSESLYSGIRHIHNLYITGNPLIPPPGESTANWPPIAKPIIDFWALASQNLHAAVMKYPDQMKTVGTWLLAAMAGFGKGILQFIASLIIAGVLLLYYDRISLYSKKIFVKLAGKDGEYFAPIAVATINKVFKGVLGVAVIQAAMAGIGFFVAGVPFPGLWTILCLILAIVQIGIWPIAIPVIIYMFSVLTTGPAIALAIWLGIALTIDNVLRPILLGMGAPAPMLVIFMGTIGGFIYNGFLGLFLGAVILTIGYKLFMRWVDKEIVG